MADETTTPGAKRSRKARPPTTPDPIEIAMEAEAGDTAADSPAQRVLIKHEKLIELDMRHRGWQIASERAGFALKMLTGLAGLAAAMTLSVMAWQASRANGVVVEPFGVPPELSGQITGQAVAAQVLDELARLNTRKTVAANDPTYSGGDRQEISLAIPGSGVNLGDLQAALRTWLGHETRISGEVFRTPNGLAIRARPAAGQAVRVEGPLADFEALSRQIAHSLYRETQPWRYASWLAMQGDRPAAFALFRQLAEGSGPETERAQAYHSWGYWLQSTDLPAAAALQRRAVALAPQDGRRWSQLASYEGALAHSELQVAYLRRAIELGRTHPNRELRREARDLGFVEAQLADAEADFQAALAHRQRLDRNTLFADILGRQVDTRFVITLAALHDISAARARMAAPRFPITVNQPGNEAFLRLALLVLSEDWATVVALEPQLEAAGFFPPSQRAVSVAWYAIVLAHAEVGDAAGALSRLPVPPPDCDTCLYWAGRVHAALGDVAQSERSFAAASRLLKELPQAHFYWGEARLRRGDAAGALPLLKEAQRRQPHWADPFKSEGDALARLGRWGEAEKAYKKAAKLAPRWGGLHLKWGEALARLGKTDEARVKWRAAATMDLSAAERAQVTALLQKRTT